MFNPTVSATKFRSANTFALVSVVTTIIAVVSIIASPLAIVLIGFNSLGTLITSGLTLLYLASLLASIIFFFLWIYRAYKNLEAFGVQMLQASPGWAIAYWFIPILNLFRPLTVMNEIYHGSDPELAGNSEFNYSSTATPLINGIWWGTRLVGSFLLQIGSSAKISELLLVSFPVLIISEILFVLIVLKINERQKQSSLKLNNQVFQAPPPPPTFA